MKKIPEHKVVPERPGAQKTREQIKEALTPEKFKQAKEEALDKGVSPEQWRDLMHVIKAKGEEVWPKDIIGFERGGTIRLKKSLDLSGCTKIERLPEGLVGETVFLSKKLKEPVQRRIRKLRDRGEITCRVLFL